MLGPLDRVASPEGGERGTRGARKRCILVLRRCLVYTDVKAIYYWINKHGGRDYK